MNKNIHNLIVRVLSGNANEQDLVQLDTWLSQGAENKKEFERLRKVWEESGNLKIEREVDVDAAWTDLQQRIEKAGSQKPASKFTVMRAAAGIALLAMLSLVIAFVLNNRADEAHMAAINRGPENVTVSTPDADFDTIAFLFDSVLASTPDSSSPIKSTVPKLRRKSSRNVVMITFTTQDTAKAFYLPDNSIVFLNEHSSVSYPQDFGKGERALALTGEAYFEPVSDSVPFVVRCGNTEAVTSKSFFNVRQDRIKNSVEVLTVSGNVEFIGLTKPQYKKLVINEGERGVYSTDATLAKEKNTQKDYKWWQKKNLRAKLRSLIDKIKNALK